jgi:hypothetical protein
MLSTVPTGSIVVNSDKCPDALVSNGTKICSFLRRYWSRVYFLSGVRTWRIHMLTEKKLNTSGAGLVFSKLSGSAGTANGCLLHQYSMQPYCYIFIHRRQLHSQNVWNRKQGIFMACMLEKLTSHSFCSKVMFDFILMDFFNCQNNRHWSTESSVLIFEKS